MKKAKKIKMMLLMMTAITCQGAAQMMPAYADTTIAGRLGEAADVIVEQVQEMTCVVDGEVLPDFLIPNC